VSVAGVRRIEFGERTLTTMFASSRTFLWNQSRKPVPPRIRGVPFALARRLITPSRGIAESPQKISIVSPSAPKALASRTLMLKNPRKK
jgi:hypothetical protein